MGIKAATTVMFACSIFLFLPGCGKSQTESEILENEIHSFSGMLSGPGQLVRAWTTGTNLLARIGDETDEQVRMNHFKEMESAILGMRFREGPYADSYNEWDHSIVIFGKLASWYSISVWKKSKDSPWLWEFYLKRLDVYRKELERIANAKEKPLPPGFNGIHGTLEATRSRLKLDRDMILRKFSSDSFVSNYLAITPSERLRWCQRIEEAAGVEFKFEVNFQTMAKKLRAINAPIKEN